MKIIDISRPLYTGAPHWPGDHDTVFKLGMRLADGKPCNLGNLKLSVHNGTHVDAPFHTDMAIHHLLDAANILILESLDLRDATPGIYELIALPLKLRGADGSPVRAVLRQP